MDEYASSVRSYDENCAFFDAHPQLLHEHAMGYLLMEALQHGMDGRMVCASPGICVALLLPLNVCALTASRHLHLCCC